MDLSTEYLGMKLKNPLVAGPSPVTREVDNIRALEDAGIAGVVLNSLFEEEIEHGHGAHEHFLDHGTDSFAESTSYTPGLDYTPVGTEPYLEHLRAVKQAVDIPVMASLNGSTRGGWVEFATELEKAGADGLELNVYQVATDPDVSPADVESTYAEILSDVCKAVKIPVAMKLAPYFSSLPHMAKRLEECGASGFVLFNRFYQPDVDIDTLEVVPNLSLSAPHEVRLPLRWIAILDPMLKASLAASTAVYTWEEVVKLLMVGADVTQLCATLLRNGAGVVPKMLEGLTAWMEEHEYESVTQLQGCMNHRTTSDPGAFERANYLRALQSYA